MTIAFSARVTSTAWRAVAVAWATQRLEEVGRTVTGPVEQPRVRPWSTQFVVPTDRGAVWFKADQEAFSFEAALQTAIARLVPGAVQTPLAVDPSRGWLLTDDHGPSLGDAGAPSVEAWCALVREAATIQRTLAAHRVPLLATGLPDCGPERAVAWFDELRTALRELPRAHPGRLRPDDDLRLGDARDLLVAACATLAASGIPTTWNHGDLQPKNAYVEGPTGQLRLFDLGDGQWAHALEILAVPHAWIRAQGLGDGSAAVTSAWAEVWGVEVDDRLLSAVRVVHAVNRSRTWWGWLDDTTPEELERFGREPREHLLRVLDEAPAPSSSQPEVPPARL
jgi:hypothetical protein